MVFGMIFSMAEALKQFLPVPSPGRHRCHAVPRLSWLVALGPLTALPLWLGMRPTMHVPLDENSTRWLVGWLLALLALDTWTALTAGACALVRGRWWGGVGLLLLSLAITLATAAATCAAFDAAVALRCLAVLGGWGILCAGMAGAFRRLVGGAAAVAGLSFITAFLLSVPISAAPVLANLGRGPLLTALVNSCPSLWLIGALRPEIRFDWLAWFHAPLIYGITPLGQNMLMPPLIHWWVMCLINVVAGLGLVRFLRVPTSSR